MFQHLFERSLMKMDFTIPKEVKEVVSSIEKFYEKEVLHIKKKDAKQFSSDRYFYDKNGLYAEETMEAIRKVRKRSAEAGYFNRFADEENGSSGDLFDTVHMTKNLEALY